MMLMVQPDSMFPERPFAERPKHWRWVWRQRWDGEMHFWREWTEFPRFPSKEDMPYSPERIGFA